MAARGGCDCYLVGLVWFGLMLAGGIIGGAERVSLKVSDPRKDLVDKYNSAVTDWDGGARDKFKKEVTPTPTVLVGSKAATEVDGLSSGDIAVPPLKDSLKSVQGYTEGYVLQGEVKDYHSGARKTTYNQHGVTSDLEKVVIGEKVASITPYKCTAWSRGALLSNEDTQFRCDDAHRKDNEYQCGPGGKYRKFARKEWVTKVTVVMDKDTAGNLKTPSKELCSYEYMIEEHSADDWKTALSKCEDDVPEKDGSPTTYDLTVLVRSEADPYVVAGSLSECKYNFGPTAAEHLEAAIGLFAGAAFGACGFALVYVARQRKLKQQAEQMASQQQMYALQQQGGVPMQAVPPGQYAQPMQPYPPQPYPQQPYPQHQVYAPQGYPAQGYPVQGPQ